MNLFPVNVYLFSHYAEALIFSGATMLKRKHKKEWVMTSRKITHVVFKIQGENDGFQATIVLENILNKLQKENINFKISGCTMTCWNKTGKLGVTLE